MRNEIFTEPSTEKQARYHWKRVRQCLAIMLACEIAMLLSSGALSAMMHGPALSRNSVIALLSPLWSSLVSFACVWSFMMESCSDKLDHDLARCALYLATIITLCVTFWVVACG